MVPGNVLVLGGSGFVSGALARQALARGCRVWTLTRGQRPLPQGAAGLCADRKDSAAFARALAGAGVRWDLAVDCKPCGSSGRRGRGARFCPRAECVRRS